MENRENPLERDNRGHNDEQIRKSLKVEYSCLEEVRSLRLACMLALLDTGKMDWKNHQCFQKCEYLVMNF